MTTIKHKPTFEPDKQTEKDRDHQLILFNDDVHTFDYVIEALIDVCDHTEEQATQCAMLVHYRGQTDVKRGNINTLRKMRRALSDRELKVQIN